MPHSEEKPLPAVGVYWIDEADYPAVRKILADGDTMPLAWAEWRKMAVEMETGLKAYGHPVMRVRIDPATFPIWCAAHTTTTGRQGRKTFVAAAVKERYGDQEQAGPMAPLPVICYIVTFTELDSKTRDFRMRRTALGLAAFASLLACAHAADAPLAVVAAENFYGDVARQIGGDRVAVVSLMNNPDQDPHLFETTPGTVRKITEAQIVIANGADYDSWMDKLIGAAPRPGRVVIDVAKLVGRKAGDNPHLWYEPATMPAAAKAMAEAFGAADAAHKPDYDARLKTFLASLKPLNDKIAAIRAKFAGAPVTASEPVFGYMADALGLKMRNERFQLSIMNDTEPAARDVAAFEQDLKDRKVRVMFFNKQASDKAVERLVNLARKSRIPVVGVTETAPPGQSYQDWMLGELNDTEKALAGPSS